MFSYDIIIRPIITERSMASVAEKKYVFEVAPNAGKIEIKKAVEEIFAITTATMESAIFHLFFLTYKSMLSFFDNIKYDFN